MLASTSASGKFQLRVCFFSFRSKGFKLHAHLNDIFMAFFRENGIKLFSVCCDSCSRFHFGVCDVWGFWVL